MTFLCTATVSYLCGPHGKRSGIIWRNDAVDASTEQAARMAARRIVEKRLLNADGLYDLTITILAVPVPVHREYVFPVSSDFSLQRAAVA
ncbi:MAG: hypothetical protein AAB652_00855 [Patescibacteria group bacterium]